MNPTRGLIICGFPCIGKSYAAENNKRVIDLEGSNFQKDESWPSSYIDKAIELKSEGFIVCLSVHQEVRDELNKRNLLYTIVYPEYSLKEHYVKRAKSRRNHPLPPEVLEKNWDKFWKSVDNENPPLLMSYKLEKRTILSGFSY